MAESSPLYLILTGNFPPESSACHGILASLSASDKLKSHVESNMSDADKSLEISGEQPRRKFVFNVWWVVFFLVFASTIGE